MRLFKYLYDFFSFNRLVTPSIIDVVYVLGAAVVTLLGALLGLLSSPLVIALFTFADRANPSATKTSTDSGIAALSILFIVAGNIVWRISCELVLVLFNIHELLESIEKK